MRYIIHHIDTSIFDRKFIFFEWHLIYHINTSLPTGYLVCFVQPTYVHKVRPIIFFVQNMSLRSVKENIHCGRFFLNFQQKVLGLFAIFNKTNCIALRIISIILHFTKKCFIIFGKNLAKLRNLCIKWQKDCQGGS